MLFSYRVGTKRQQVNALLHLLPPSFGRYFEPMCGNADVFWALRISGMVSTAFLADIDPLIVAAYIGVRDDVDEVIAVLDAMDCSEEGFKRYRKERMPNIAGEAARAMYLGALSFNGTWRFNKRGEFTSTYNHRPERIPKAGTLRRASSLLQGVDIRQCDYEDAVCDACSGDFVYFDPPYFGGSRMYRNTFDHRRLRVVAGDLRNRGVHVMVSYRVHPDIDQLYEGWERVIIPVRQNVPGSIDSRGYVQDVAYLSYSVISLFREIVVS